MKRILLICTAIAYHTIVLAQQPNKDSVHQLSPIEVRATRVNEKMPFAATNLSEKQIEKQNLGFNLPYLLGQIPSVITSSDDGVGVGYSALRIRGTDMTRINVTFNGIPVNDPESQGTFFVNTSDIASSTSSIQVQRGVGSSTNGAGAFGGSVNISNIEQDSMASSSISNSYGSFQTRKHTLKAATGLLLGGFQADIRLSEIHSLGFVERASSNLKSLQFLTGWTSKNKMTNIKFNLLTGKEITGQAWNGVGVIFDTKDAGKINYKDELEKVGRRSNTLGMMMDASGKTSYYDDQTDNYQQTYYQLFVNHKFNPYWLGNISFFSTRGKGFYNEYKDGDAHEGEKFSSYGLPNYSPAEGVVIKRVNLVRQLWLDNYFSGSVFSLSYDKNNTNIIFGGAYTDYDAKHYGFITWAQYGVPLNYRWYNLTAFKNDFNIYGKWQQQIAKGLFTFIDLQLRNVNYNINGFRKNPDVFIKSSELFFNPKFGINYQVKHNGRHFSRLFGSYAVANKEPNRDDFEASPQQLPKPENLQDIELGYLFSAPVWNVGANLYYMKYKDQLILTGKINDVGAYSRINVPKSYRAGVELTGSLRPSDFIELNLNITLGKNKIKNFIQYSDDYDKGGQIVESFTNTDIAFSPNTIMGGTATFQPFHKATNKNHFFIDLVQKYVGRQYLDNSSSRFKSIQPYSLTDLRFRYQLHSNLFKKVELLALINNVFDKKYENNGYTYSYMYDDKLTVNNFYFPQAGTTWNIGLTFGF